MNSVITGAPKAGAAMISASARQSDRQEQHNLNSATCMPTAHPVRNQATLTGASALFCQHAEACVWPSICFIVQAEFMPCSWKEMKLASLLCALLISIAESRSAILTISDSMHHLGVQGKPEWQHFVDKTPEGESLRLTFEARQNSRESTIFIRQDDVKQEWSVTLNGRKAGQLFLMEADLVHTIALPPGALRDG